MDAATGVAAAAATAAFVASLISLQVLKRLCLFLLNNILVGEKNARSFIFLGRLPVHFFKITNKFFYAIQSALFETELFPCTWLQGILFLAVFFGSKSKNVQYDFSLKVYMSKNL